MTSIFLADDHPAFRAGIRALVERHEDLRVVGEADTGFATLEAVADLAPDVLLLDMEMPDMSGLQVARTLRERGDAVVVLPLSGFTDTEYVLGCLEAGASGYLTKDTPVDAMIQAIRTVVKGGVYVSPKTAVDIVRSRHEAFSDDERRKKLCSDLGRRGITPRLFRILKHVAEGRSNAEIGSEEFRSENTIRNQVEQIKEALDVRWRPALVAWAWRNSVVDIDDATFAEYCHGP